MINNEHDTFKSYVFSILDHINLWSVLSITCQECVNGDKESQSLNTKECLIFSSKGIVADIYRYVFSHLLYYIMANIKLIYFQMILLKYLYNKMTSCISNILIVKHIVL